VPSLGYRTSVWCGLGPPPHSREHRSVHARLRAEGALLATEATPLPPPPSTQHKIKAPKRDLHAGDTGCAPAGKDAVIITIKPVP
jgi:hypothetical protein